MAQFSEQWEESKRRARTYPMEYLLRHLGVQFSKDGMVSCPFHQEKTPSASIGKENILNCFGCGAKRKNNIDIYMEIKGVDFRTAVNEINNLEGLILPDRKEAIEEVKKKKPPTNPEESYQKFIAGFVGYKLLSKKERAKIDDFLKDKHLEQAIEILHKNKFDIGLDRYKNIAFSLNGFGISRREKKENRGLPQPTILKVNKSNIWYICEGITDAITACILGFNAISTNSVSNVDALIEKLSSTEKSKNKHYIICTDQDKYGSIARKKLQDFFYSNNYSYNVNTALYSSSYNDLNDWYIANKDNLIDYFNIRKKIDAGTYSSTIFGNMSVIELTNSLLEQIGFKAYVPQLNEYCGEINYYKETLD